MLNLHEVHARESDRAHIANLTDQYLQSGGQITTVADNIDPLQMIVSMRARNQSWIHVANEVGLSQAKCKAILADGIARGMAPSHGDRNGR